MRTSYQGMTYKEYVTYLIKECHMSFIDADREATETFREDEPTDKPVCDRNICVSNEYNGIGCDECVVNKEQEPCTEYKTPCSLCRYREETSGLCDMCPAMPIGGADR